VKFAGTGSFSGSLSINEKIQTDLRNTCQDLVSEYEDELTNLLTKRVSNLSERFCEKTVKACGRKTNKPATERTPPKPSENSAHDESLKSNQKIEL